jgi:hypothetical protein
MDLREWEVPIDERQPLAEAALHRLDEWISAPAMRTLEVAVLDENDGSVERSRDMIALADVNGEVAHGCARKSDDVDAEDVAESDSSALRIPSAPGLTPIGER